MPRIRTMVRRGAPSVLEGTLIPLGIFYLAMWLLGIWGAIALSLAWSWGAIALRLATHRRVPGLLVVGALALTVRSLMSFLADSVFLYFLQPTLGTVVLAAAFLISVPAGSPLAARLTHDFMPMPAAFSAHPAIRRFFVRVSILWGGIQLANAAIGLWLLVSQPISVYLVTKTAATSLIMGIALLGCVVWFRRILTSHGLGSGAPAG
jgi:hypothetical protein